MSLINSSRIDTRSYIGKDIKSSAVENFQLENKKMKEAKEKMWCGKNKEWYKRITYVLSYPATRTKYFNEDGNNLFHSRVMFIIFIPSFLFFLLLMYMFISAMTSD